MRGPAPADGSAASDAAGDDASALHAPSPPSGAAPGKDAAGRVDERVEIAAAPERVWQALVDPAQMTWLGARVESTFVVGEAIRFDYELHGESHRDLGTLLALEPQRRLEYDHWSALSGQPDRRETRTRVSIELDELPAGTVVHVQHEGFHREEAFKHARFFWRGALHELSRRLRQR